jgi:glycosyltransferase involved in cell wall biosynthesis
VLKIKLFVDGTAPYHVALAREVFSQSVVFELVEAGEAADLIYHIFGPDLHWGNLRLWLGRKRHIVHWIGSDTRFYDAPSKLFDGFVRIVKKALLSQGLRSGRVKYISSAPWIGARVQAAAGFEVPYVLISTVSRSRIKLISVTRDIDFITYIPKGREETYSLQPILDAANRFKERSFVIVVPNIQHVDELEWNIGCSNVTIFPQQTFESMIRLISRSRCFLRLKTASEDAYALTVLESLYCGCNVVWNVSSSGLDGVFYLADDKSLEDFLDSEVLGLLLSENGRESISDNINEMFSLDKWIEGLEMYALEMFGDMKSDNCRNIR